MPYSVMTDTSANLPTKMLKELSIAVIPFVYIIEGQEYTCMDTDAFDGDAYYQSIKTGVTVTTAQISPGVFRDCFERELKKGNDVLFVSMSSGISGSCGSARVAAEMLKTDYPERRVEVVDTLGASLGEGIIALYAARFRDLGVGLMTAVSELNYHVRRMFQVFTVDDLMHLKRGGRLSNLAATVGTVLQIKPLLKGNENGNIVSFGKARGRKRSVEALAQYYEKLVSNPGQQIVGIAQAGCREDAEFLEELLNKKKPPKEILTVEYEPVTGSHVGPGALALFFEGDDDVRLAR